MPIENIQKCPTCGQSVNAREINLNLTMVQALFLVWKWCIEKERFENIKRSEFSHLWGHNETITANFGYWIDFGNSTKMVTRGASGRGYYNFDPKTIGQFLQGKIQIPSKIIRNPLEIPTDTFHDPKMVTELPDLGAFLDENKDYIVTYLPADPVLQQNLFEAKYPSSSRRGIYYTVKEDSDGHFSCECEAFRFRQQCQHIGLAIRQKSENAMQKLL